MARSLVLCITSICFPIVCFFHFLTYSLIYSLIFGTDLTLVHDIGTILKINKKGKIKETSLERLRSAFVMATGRVFSNLKYMQMPRYLESQQYEELITENEHLHGIQKQFESSIVKQKIPIQFILNKPNISGFLIAYIAKREDGNVWLQHIDLLAEIDDLLEGSQELQWGKNDESKDESKAGAAGGGGEAGAEAGEAREVVEAGKSIVALEDSKNENRQELFSTHRNEQKEIEKFQARRSSLTIVLVQTTKKSKIDRKLIRHRIMLKRFQDIYPTLLLQVQEENKKTKKETKKTKATKETKEREKTEKTEKTKEKEWTNEAPTDELLVSVKNYILLQLELIVMSKFRLTDTCRLMKDSYIRNATLLRKSDFKELQGDTQSTDIQDNDLSLTKQSTRVSMASTVSTSSISTSSTREEKLAGKKRRRQSATGSSIGSMQSTMIPFYLVNEESLNENQKDLLMLIHDSHGMYHLMKFARSHFLEENVRFLRETSSIEIDFHVISPADLKAKKLDDVEINTSRRFAFQVRVKPGNGEWLKYIEQTYILPGAPMEINLSSQLRCSILQDIHKNKTHIDIEDYDKEREQIRDLLKPARKQVMDMLTNGFENCLFLFRKTPMYQVSLESRHRKQKGGRVGGMGFNASGFVDKNTDERLIP